MDRNMDLIVIEPAPPDSPPPAPRAPAGWT